VEGQKLSFARHKEETRPPFQRSGVERTNKVIGHRVACLPAFACYPWIDMSLTHENLPAAIENLSARIIAIRDSL
jgi:hypothetical protein